MNSKSNIEKLGETLNKRIQNVFNAREGVIAELGTINGSLGLKVDSLSNAIPKGQYLISTRLTMGSTGADFTTTTTDGYHAHNHRVNLPAELRSLKSGDRVLVIWCGNEPVVTDILTDS